MEERRGGDRRDLPEGHLDGDRFGHARPPFSQEPDGGPDEDYSLPSEPFAPNGWAATNSLVSEYIRWM